MNEEETAAYIRENSTPKHKVGEEVQLNYLDSDGVRQRPKGKIVKVMSLYSTVYYSVDTSLGIMGVHSEDLEVMQRRTKRGG